MTTDLRAQALQEASDALLDLDCIELVDAEDDHGWHLGVASCLEAIRRLRESSVCGMCGEDRLLVDYLIIDGTGSPAAVCRACSGLEPEVD